MKRIKACMFLYENYDKPVNVLIILTDDEYKQMKKAELLSFLRFWELNKCIADYMSSELEDLLCGYRTDRYITLGWG